MGAYDGPSHPRRSHSYCMSAEISYSLTPGFTAFIAAKCAATDASTALRRKAISLASLTVRWAVIIVRTSWKKIMAVLCFRNTIAWLLGDGSPFAGISV